MESCEAVPVTLGENYIYNREGIVHDLDRRTKTVSTSSCNLFEALGGLLV